MSAVKIKALEWGVEEESWHMAMTPFGYGYEVRITERGAVRWRSGRGPWEYFDGSFGEAKAACQHHFEGLVRSVISESKP